MGETLRNIVAGTGVAGVALSVLAYIFRDIIRKKIFPKLTRNQAFALLLFIISCTTIVVIFALYRTIVDPPSPQTFDIERDVKLVDNSSADSSESLYKILALRNPTTTIQAKLSVVGAYNYHIIPCYSKNKAFASHVKVSAQADPEELILDSVFHGVPEKIKIDKTTYVIFSEMKHLDREEFNFSEFLLKGNYYCSYSASRQIVSKVIMTLISGAMIEKYFSIFEIFSFHTGDNDANLKSKYIDISALGESDFERLSSANEKSVGLRHPKDWLTLGACMYLGGDTEVANVNSYVENQLSEGLRDIATKVKWSDCGIIKDVQFDSDELLNEAQPVAEQQN